MLRAVKELINTHKNASDYEGEFETKLTLDELDSFLWKVRYSLPSQYTLRGHADILGSDVYFNSGEFSLDIIGNVVRFFRNASIEAQINFGYLKTLEAVNITFWSSACDWIDLHISDGHGNTLCFCFPPKNREVEEI